MGDQVGSLDAREQLRQHFNVEYVHHNDCWDKLWKKGDFLPWDRGEPNPALIDTLTDRRDLVGRPVASKQGRRKRALVPGCGKGYDVLVLASFGYDAYGLDVSASAVKASEEFAEKEFANYTEVGSEYGCGAYKFLYGDFFKDDWVKQGGFDGGFDLIYDYTFLSALPPEARPAWALGMTRLLAPGPDSRLICVEFPTYKEPSTGGPPFGLPSQIYLAHLHRPGEDVAYDEKGFPVKSALPHGSENGSFKSPSSLKSPSSQALVRIGHWQPERTHPIGNGTDWVSVWGHK